MTEMPVVHLNPAFTYVCDNCGRDNFARTVRVEDPEMKEQATAAFREMIQLVDGEDAAEQWDGELTMAPTSVTCEHCHSQYQVAASQYELEEMDMFFDEDDDLELDDDEFDDEDDDWDDDWDDEDDDEFDDEDFEDDLDDEGGEA